MKILSAKFIKGINGTDEILYDGRFQVAFLGRSNVGKSTLINALTMRQSLARSSSTPGKTIRMDFFLINDKFYSQKNSVYFVDFPGYGFAQRSLEKREKLGKMILWYLRFSEVKQRLAVLIIDAKVGLMPFDLDMLKTLREEKIDFLLVVNKVDNLKMGEREKQLEKIKSESGNAEIIAFSSKEKEGRAELMQKISSYLVK